MGRVLFFQVSGSLLLMIWLTGCGQPSGPQPVPVSGTVFLDGEPLEGAEVHFASPNFVGVGMSRSDGRYELVQGAVPGENKIYITKKSGGADPSTILPQFGEEGFDETQAEAALEGQRDPMSGELPADIELPKELIPEQFSDPQKTKLTYPVPEAGATGADFRLSSQ